MVLEKHDSNLIMINDEQFSPLEYYVETGVLQESIEITSNHNIYTEV